jgi:hypothetical protein
LNFVIELALNPAATGYEGQTIIARIILVRLPYLVVL